MTDSFSRAVRVLRNIAPVKGRKVQVRRGKIKAPTLGDCGPVKSGLLIRVSDLDHMTPEQIKSQLQTWVLFHEWAHALTHGLVEAELDDDHGIFWGAALAMLERKYLKAMEAAEGCDPRGAGGDE